MNPFEAKGIFLNERTALKGLGVDPLNLLPDLLVDGGFHTIYYHILDGPREKQVQTNWWPARMFDPKWQPNTREEIIQAIQAAGIQVVGWGMVYGNSPAEEGKMAARMVDKFGLTGWVIDVEQQLDLKPNAVELVRTIVSTYRENCDKPIGYCSWPNFHNLHPVPVAETGMQLCDVGIPMAYVREKDLKEAPICTKEFVDKSIAEWRQFTDKPLVMAGRAFKEDGFTTTSEAILAFDQRIRELGAVGSAWWFLDHAQPSTQPTWWEALKSTSPFNGRTIRSPERHSTDMLH